MLNKVLVVVVLLAIAGCGDVKIRGREFKTNKIVEVGTCTETTGDWFNGYDPGECVVKLDDGNIVTVRAPVMVGQSITFERDVFKDKNGVILEPLTKWQVTRD